MLTNFGALTQNQLTVWMRTVWREARNKSYLFAFAGTDENSMIQRVTALSKTTDGARAVITLVSDSQGDGVVGDNELETNEEALSANDQIISIDQLRHAHRQKGRMAEQASVVKFRDVAKNNLTYWLSDRVDQLGFLVASGISFSQQCNGAPRIGSQWPLLKYAADVSVPSANRYFRWNAAATTLLPGDTTQIVAADKPTWKMLVQLKAQAVNSYIRPLRDSNGIEAYNVFMCPDGIAALKQDADFIEIWKLAQERGKNNPIFKGTAAGGKVGIYIDGLNILEYRHVYNTDGAASGLKWGSGGTVDGQRVLLMGAQALAFADIGMARWDEKEFDYGNSVGIATGKIFGILKPKLFSIYSQSKEDFSIIACDTAI